MLLNLRLQGLQDGDHDERGERYHQQPVAVMNEALSSTTDRVTK